MLQIPSSSTNKIVIPLPGSESSSRNENPSSRGINPKGIIEVYFTIERYRLRFAFDYNAGSEEPIAVVLARYHPAVEIVGQRWSRFFRVELVSRFERNSRLSGLESAAILALCIASIPVEPIFNGFVTPAIEFFHSRTPLFSRTTFSVRMRRFLRILREIVISKEISIWRLISGVRSVLDERYSFGKKVWKARVLKLTSNES